MENLKEYRKILWDEIKFVPTEGQKPIFENLYKYRNVLVTGGEGSGKSLIAGVVGVEAAPRSNLIWLAGEEYAHSRQEFEYMVGWLGELGFLAEKPSFPKEGECSLKTIHNTRVVTKSVKDPSNIMAESPELIIVCEAGHISFESFLRLGARVARTRGRLFLEGTLEDSLGWYAEYATMWGGLNQEDSRSFSLPSWSNFHKYPLGREDPEIKRQELLLGHDLFMERFAGQVCKPSNLILPEFSNSIHVRDFKELFGEEGFNKELDVEIAVDPGYSGASAVLAIQHFSDTVYLIDEVYLQGYVTEEIIDICKQKRWWGKVVNGAIDFAGRQHQAMPAPVEVWQDKAKLYLSSRKITEEGGIDLLRTFLKPNPVTRQPKVYVSPNCRGFIAECGGGRSPVPNGGIWLRDKNTGRPTDKNNHAAKALIYWLVNRFGYTEREGKSVWGQVFRPSSDRRSMEAIRR